jgi:hypothetical protein
MSVVGVRVCIILIAIGFAPAAATTQTDVDNEADAKEIASYRLTMDGGRKMAIVMRAAFQEQKKDPAYQELARIEGGTGTAGEERGADRRGAAAHRGALDEAAAAERKAG